MAQGIILTAEEREKCEGCSACRGMRGKKERLEVCLPTILENNSPKIPSYYDAQKDEIDMSRIPEGCPRGYVSSSRREIR